MDLVEIVDGEDQVALGRGEAAEIGDMHVAARRHRQPGNGVGQIVAITAAEPRRKAKGEASMRA